MLGLVALRDHQLAQTLNLSVELLQLFYVLRWLLALVGLFSLAITIRLSKRHLMYGHANAKVTLICSVSVSQSMNCSQHHVWHNVNQQLK